MDIEDQSGNTSDGGDARNDLINSPNKSPGKTPSSGVDKGSPVESVPLSPEVIQAITELFPSSDPLDQVNFDPIEYINNRFPTQQSMSQLDDVMSVMRKKIDNLDTEISNVLKNQSTVEDEGKGVLDEVTQVISQLTIKIKDMKEQAQDSQKMVNDITSDIKSLDHAKRNLTSSIVLLNNLHILVEGVEKMKSWMIHFGQGNKQLNYGLLAPTLESCLEVLNQLKHHLGVPQIQDLAVSVDDIRSKLGSQIIKDFNTIYIDGKLPLDVQGGSNRQLVSPLKILADACLVVDSLDPSIRNQLIDKITNHELQEYRTLFQANQDISWLDKVDKRFNWFKKHLVQFEERYGLVFPLKWEVSERIAVHFCHTTNEHLTQIMDARKRYDEIKLDDLMFAFSKSSSFEHLLSQKFPGLTLSEKIDKSVDPNKKRLNPFQGLITTCFEPYLTIFVSAQDKNISQLIESFVDDMATKNSLGPAPSTSAVFPSSGILFTQYKSCLIQCVNLSTGTLLRDLSNKCFKENLILYANKVLLGSLPELPTSSSGSSSWQSVVAMSKSPSTISAGTTSAIATKATNAIQSFLKSEEGSVFQNGQLIEICSIILTANYCLETTQQLEKKLKEKVDENLRQQIDMSKEIDSFNNVINTCLDLLIGNFDLVVSPSLNSMKTTNWSVVETPTKPSSFVSDMVSKLQVNFQLIRDNLSEARKYFYISLCQVCRTVHSKIQEQFDPVQITFSRSSRTAITGHASDQKVTDRVADIWIVDQISSK